MSAGRNFTRIVVDGAALARAAYPVTVDPEIGANDFRISDLGPDGDPSFDASSAAVTANGQGNEYLVVWSGDDSTQELVDDELVGPDGRRRWFGPVRVAGSRRA